MATPQNILVLKDKVQRYLSDMGVRGIEITEHGAFSFRYGSARVYVDPKPWGDESSLVTLTVPLLNGCQPSPELFHYVATSADDYVFGHLSAYEHEGVVALFFTHNLLGDYLDPQELQRAVGGIATTADKLDTELHGRFGGELYYEDSPSTEP